MEDPFYDDTPEMVSGKPSTTVKLRDIEMDSNFAMLLCSLIFAISWVIYIMYYNSRLVGFMITKIVNRLFIKDGYFKIGKFLG